MAHPFRSSNDKRIPKRDLRFPSGLRLRQVDMEGKGEKGKRCNVNACQLPGSAYHYNLVMKKYYCYHCAKDIQSGNHNLMLFEDFYKKETV